jgi:aminomethyltransferase
LDKGDFHGKNVVMKAKAEGIKRKLVGFTLNDKAFPRHGYAIHSNGEKIGDVTSGTFSPILDKGIGMGYVPIAHTKAGTTLHVMIRNKEVAATITALPFIKK